MAAEHLNASEISGLFEEVAEDDGPVALDSPPLYFPKNNKN